VGDCQLCADIRAARVALRDHTLFELLRGHRAGGEGLANKSFVGRQLSFPAGDNYFSRFVVGCFLVLGSASLLLQRAPFSSFFCIGLEVAAPVSK